MSRWPLSLDKHLSGLLAPATVEELLTKEFDKQLWPGPHSKQERSVLQRQGPACSTGSRTVHPNVKHTGIADGCQTNTYMQWLIDTLLSTLTSSRSGVMTQPFPKF